MTERDLEVLAHINEDSVNLTLPRADMKKLIELARRGLWAERAVSALKLAESDCMMSRDTYDALMRVLKEVGEP